MPPFRVAFVPGATPGKWQRIWDERHPRDPLELVAVEESDQRAVLVEGRADVAIVRSPIARDRLHLIPLYEEVAVAVASRDHVLAAFDQITSAELADEVHHVLAADLSAQDAIAAAAAGVGYVLLPMSVARLHHRRDVVQVPVTDLDRTQVGLAWLDDARDTRIQDFIGIVRGRTANSSRSH